MLRRSILFLSGQTTPPGGRRRAGLAVRQNRRVPVHQITDPDDDRIADYRALTDVELRTRWEPPHGLFIAEGELVLRRALRAGYPARSYLVDAKRVDQLADLDTGDAPVYAATQDVLQRATGFHVHRGCWRRSTAGRCRRRPRCSPPRAGS